MLENIEQTLNKYYFELESKKREYIEIYEGAREGIAYTQKLLKMTYEEAEKEKRTISIYDLARILRFASLTMWEKMQVVIHFLKLNIYAGIMEEEYALDKNIICAYPFKTMNKERIKNLIESGDFLKLVEAKARELSPNERLEQEEIKEALKESGRNILNTALAHRQIKEHFFDKYPYLTKEDIDIFVECLASLGMSLDICEGFKVFLNQEWENQKLRVPSYEDSLLSKYYNGLKQASKIYEKSVANFENTLYKMATKQVYRKLASGNRRITSKMASVIASGTADFDDYITDAEKAIASISVYGGGVYNWLSYPEMSRFSNLLIADFASLSETISQASFTKSELSDFIFLIIKRDIELGILDEKGSLQSDEFLSYEDDVLSACREGRFWEMILKNENHHEVAKSHLYCPLDCEKDDLKWPLLQEQIKIIAEIYFAKDKLTKEDITKICESLTSLGFSKAHVDAVESTLVKRNLRKEKEKKEDSITIQKSLITLRPLISKKEYNRLWNELNECYNFDQMIPFRYLSEEEIITCVYKLKYLNFADAVILKFLETSLKYNKTNSFNAIVKYKDTYAKIKYFLENYPEDEKIKEIALELDEALKKAGISSDEDFEFYKEYIDMELASFTDATFHNYEYEIEMAKLL